MGDGSASARRCWRRRQDGAVAGGEHDGVGHVDVAEPGGRVEAGEREAGLHRLALIRAIAARARSQRRRSGSRRARRMGARGHGPAAGDEARGRSPASARGPGSGGRWRRARGRRRGRGGGATRAGRWARPSSSRRRSARSMPSASSAATASSAQSASVTRSGERMPAAVATVVDGDDAEPVGQRRVGREPVDVGGDADAVQEQHGRSPVRGAAAWRTNVVPRPGRSSDRPGSSQGAPSLKTPSRDGDDLDGEGGAGGGLEVDLVAGLLADERLAERRAAG